MILTVRENEVLNAVRTTMRDDGLFVPMSALYPHLNEDVCRISEVEESLRGLAEKEFVEFSEDEGVRPCAGGAAFHKAR